jgi:hypothetical protein
MKKLIVLLMFLLAAPVMEVAGNPWHTKTSHKPIKKMTRKQVRKAQVGYTLYERNPRTGKVEKNMNRPWSTLKKPTSYNAFHHKKK